MPEDHPSVLEKLAHITRYLLVALFAASLGSGWINGASGDRAFAAAPVAAAPGYLSCSIKSAGNSKLYITDTNKKVVCVYTLSNEQLRLVSVRKIDADSHIVDASIKAPIALDGVVVTREQAQQYVKNCQPILDAAAKKFGQTTLKGE